MKWALRYFKFKHITEIMPAHGMCGDELTPQKRRILWRSAENRTNATARRIGYTSRAHLFEAPNDFRVPIKSFKV